MSVSEKIAGISWKFTLFKYMMYAVGELADEILHEMVLKAQFPEERTPTCPGAAGMDVKRFDRHATKVGTEMFAALTHVTGGITQQDAEWLADSSWTGRFVTLTEMSGLLLAPLRMEQRPMLAGIKSMSHLVFELRLDGVRGTSRAGGVFPRHKRSLKAWGSSSQVVVSNNCDC